MALLLAKGDRLEDWRGLDEFVAGYRQAAIRTVAARQPEAMGDLLAVIGDELGMVAAQNRQFIEQCDQLSARLTSIDDQEALLTLVTGFYETAYGHFRRFQSPPAFFEAANAFLAALIGMQVRTLRQQDGVELPPLALLALGPAGRFEYTRFCRVQLALVWDGAGTPAEDQLMAEFAEELMAWLRACGIALEEAISPLQPDWRGSLEQWRERLECGVAGNDKGELIELVRLVDQAVLVDQQGLAGRFRELCSEQLRQRPAVANLVERCTVLSNGLGMMGGFRLNRSGPYRGRFALLQHALLPLGACVGGLCLHHDLVEDGTPRRLRELVRNGRLDVDLAERALQAWHLFSRHRLTLELAASPGQDCRDILNLDLALLNHDDQEQLRTSLETVADLQRHLHVSFGQQA
jgi:signal-transduction protein with cAMP-binding, CBS, and nucleotidyltransferase domain